MQSSKPPLPRSTKRSSRVRFGGRRRPGAHRHPGTHGAVQRGFAEEQRLLVRIGVHLGEIIIEAAGHDIFGDRFNLAERI
jgi:hypothetical protein